MHTPRAELTGTQLVSAHRYRGDIDGLRAIAVLSVVAFHAFPTIVPSGFVGVDIFFVISGFLITSIIFDGLAKHQFSFAIFYARRIRRIFPALIVVLIACLAVGAFLLLPGDFRVLGKHTVAGAGFVSNFALWKEANYFDLASDAKVLLHLWSLGIEEQFYLIWPLLVWIAWRLRLNRFSLFAAIFVASLAYCIKITPLNPVAAFYSPASRFWELAAGSILAQLDFSRPRAVACIESAVAGFFSSLLFERGTSVDHQKLYRDILSTAGIALVIASISMITRRHEFPGWWALMPVVGAYLILAAGPEALLNRLLLSNRVMVWLGLISYPLYLWHWPLLVFTRAWLGELGSAPVRCGVIALSVGLAWLTYAALEKRVRFGKSSIRSVYVLGCALLMVAALGAAALVYGGAVRPVDINEYAIYFDSFRTGVSPAREEMVEVNQNQCNFYDFESALPTRVPRAAISPDCYTSHSRKSVLLLGDSHSAHLFYGMKKTLPSDVSLLLVYGSGCRPHPIDVTKLETDYCEKANSFALSTVRQVVPDVVVIAFNNSFETDYLRQLSREIRQLGVKRVIVLGLVPHWDPYLFKVVMQYYWESTPKRISTHLDQHALEIDKAFKNELQANEPFEYQSLFDFFCNAEGCLTYLGGNRREGLVSFDNAHLRPLASLYLAEHLLTPLVTRDF